MEKRAGFGGIWFCEQEEGGLGDLGYSCPVESCLELCPGLSKAELASHSVSKSSTGFI